MRPGGAGSMLAAQHMAESFAAPAPKPIPLPEGGGDRNAIPIYQFPNAHVVHHFIPEMPLRVSAIAVARRLPQRIFHRELYG